MFNGSVTLLWKIGLKCMLNSSWKIGLKCLFIGSITVENRAKMYVKYSCLKFPLFVVSLDISSGGKLICIDNNYNNNYICIKNYNKCQVFTDLEAAY